MIQMKNPQLEQTNSNSRPRWYICECGVDYHKYDAMLRHIGSGRVGHSYYDDKRYERIFPQLTRWYPSKKYPGMFLNIDDSD